MRVVVVGATGNIGTSLVEALSGDEHVDDIVGIARRRPGWRPAKTTWVQADITCDGLQPHFQDADVVVQLAWIFQPTHNALVTWRNNVLGERVLDRFERDHPQPRVVRLRPGFIIAADPELNRDTLGELFGARPVKLPVRPIRAAVAAAWHLHLVPASPTLLDLALSLPLMDTTRAGAELGWTPSRTSCDAMHDFLDGLSSTSGMNTPPLQPLAGRRWRGKKLATGVGQRQ